MMSSGNKNPEGLFGTVKVGFGAGLVAGCALFSSFLSIDQQINIPHGTFYKTIGIPMGVEGMGAVWIGLMMHMVVIIMMDIILLALNIMELLRQLAGNMETLRTQVN